MYPKNNASPPVYDVGTLVQTADGAMATSGASARVKIGTGSWGAAAGTLDCDATSGIWTYVPSQAETNAESFIVGVYKTGCISISRTIVPTESSTAGRVVISGTTTTLDALQTALNSAHGLGSWATATGFSTHSAADVWSVGTRTITGGSLTTSPPTAAAIADAVWDEVRAGHTTTGTFGLYLDAQVSTASGGGGGTVNVLPAQGVVADRAATTTLKPVVGETISQSITVYQSDGTTAYDLSGKTLAIIFETLSGTDVAVVDAADITIGGTDDNVVTFAYPSAVTASVRTLSFAIRDAAAPKTMYLQGVCSVVSAPTADS